MKELILTYYGDDFTGSTDALDALTTGGVKSVLFLERPTAAQLGDFPGVEAVGLAGISRSMTPDQMDESLPADFEALKHLGARLCHYKVCSTFDSSPTIGSIGRALEIGIDSFRPDFVPVVVGAPALRRYVAFGNLFATAGTETSRIDRHPTMSRHPVTPMHESDLRRHLGQQMAYRTGLVDLLTLDSSDDGIEERIRVLLDEGYRAVLFDTLDNDHLLSIGRLLWKRSEERPLFIVGSSGVEYALVAWWRASTRVSGAATFPSPGPAVPIVVVSGSASPVTAEQIGWAEAQDFRTIRLDVPRLLDDTTAEEEREKLSREAVASLAEGRSVLLYSARGPDDPAVRETRSLDRSAEGLGRRIGAAQGQLLRRVLEQTTIRRICVAGGDTCGHVMRQLGIYALTVRAPLDPGAPLCVAHAHEPRLDGLELSLKGGQLGARNYFVKVREGS